jgi:hypothetical protein
MQRDVERRKVLRPRKLGKDPIARQLQHDAALFLIRGADSRDKPEFCLVSSRTARQAKTQQSRGMTSKGNS